MRKLAVLAWATSVAVISGAWSDLSAQAAEPPVTGRWDLRVTGPRGEYPSWLEVLVSGGRILVGRFVGRVGSARPISRLTWDNGVLRFAVPPQWDRDDSDLHFEARLEGDRLVGTITNPGGRRDAFVGSRAPALIRATPSWGDPIELFDGKDLTGWKTEGGGGESHWTVVNGVLTNAKPGANLMTDAKFADFKLHVEFLYPKNGNSGVYLRGRYEVQIEDSPRRDIPLPDDIGAVYGFLWPNENAATGPGTWQSYDIILIGRRVTVVLNGHPIIVDQLIPGPTGGALDSDEAAPGPILLQGDHTAIEYRNIRIWPAR
jgi:hypothetical protein